MMHKNKLIGVFCVNLLIIILEFIALVLSLVEQGLESFLFYTRDSNYLAMAVSLLFCIYAVKEMRGKGKLPAWIHSMRYIACSCLMVTFFVVIFVLMPMMGEDALFMLYGGSMLYQHTLCPILAVFSFYVLEMRNNLPKADVIKALIPTLIYAVITITLNICKIIEGPYFFLMVYSQPWYMSVIWCMVVLGIAGFLAFVVWKMYNFVCKKRID
ncbi:MAG: hypothetical protein HDT42_00705 [Ruminococcaceae bacterium]|nr:hypothetical protein [Oscillospiraceae bacterium]